jgi:hypothetical protein
MMMSDGNKFAVLILSHGRADNVYTLETLRRCGYTGNIYFVLDDEDPTADQYRNQFGAKNVIVFSKREIAKTFDVGDSIQDLPPAVVYARNASFQIARDLGLDYFMQLDDDYTSFMFRWADGDVLKHCMIKNMDEVLEAMIQFVADTGADTFAMAQGGDFIGGVEGSAVHRPLMRKAMNSFIFKTDNPVTFIGRINEDVNTYVVEGMRGKLYLTTTAVMLTQQQTQKNKGGLTEIYLATGTYMKSMYTVMMCPSCVTVRQMGPSNPRLHHSVRWDNAVPKILSDRYRKG